MTLTNVKLHVVKRVVWQGGGGGIRGAITRRLWFVQMQHERYASPIVIWGND